MVDRHKAAIRELQLLSEANKDYAYTNKWASLFDDDKTPPKKKEKWISAGGLVVPSLHPDEIEYCYVRRPSGGYGGKLWTFPKGMVDEGETKQIAALREVDEEIGVPARIIEYIGKYEGTMSHTHYYVMVQTGSRGGHDDETSAVRLVTLDNAEAMFKTSGNRRDAKVVHDARKIIEKLKAKGVGRNVKRRLKIQKYEVSAYDVAADWGIKSVAHDDDPKLTVLKIDRRKKNILKRFLKATGLERAKLVKGSHYFMAIIDKNKFNAATVTRTVPDVRMGGR